ncbi:MAG: hypothetical protein KIT57_10090 [Blastocatellales bacterium]|nr:hypothetical protein [Blastocatellales bacterium]
MKRKRGNARKSGKDNPYGQPFDKFRIVIFASFHILSRPMLGRWSQAEVKKKAKMRDTVFFKATACEPGSSRRRRFPNYCSSDPQIFRLSHKNTRIRN